MAINNKKFTYKTTIILLTSTIMTILIASGVGVAHAELVDVLSTVEINSSTTNGPVLSNNDNFGSSVSDIGDIDGDGVVDIAVGASTGDLGKGAIHIILLNSDGTPKSTVEINSSTTNGPVLNDGDSFGSSVSDIGDLDLNGVVDIAVGASTDDYSNSGAKSGAIHIILLNSDGTPKSTVEINGSTTNGPVLSNNDRFGSSVSDIGDIDGDGVVDIAVGAFGDDLGKGAIHIILLNSDGTPKSTVEINGSTTNGPVLNDVDFFGSSVSDIGDIDGDGVVDIAVGAFGDSNDKGAIHIILLNSDGTPKSTVEINSSTTNGPVLNDGDSFGSSVSDIGDLDLNGVVDIAVGAEWDANGKGAIHIILLNSDGTPKSTVEINSSTTNGPVLSNNDNFGSSVSDIGDLDLNGVVDIAVGASNDNNGKGAIHIINLSSETLPWKRTANNGIYYNPGNVGIGTNSPSADLEISGPSNTDAIIWDGGNGILRHHFDALTWNRQAFHVFLDADNNQSDSQFRIFNDVSSSIGNSTPVISFSLDGGNSWIDSGNIGIGTTSPNSALHVSGYVQLDTSSGTPPSGDCDAYEEYGRMKVDSTASSNKLYICTPSGWATK